MSLENSLKKIKRFILKRYGDNLAAILLFGTAHTGEFKEGVSDIDIMIFLKKQGDSNLDEESASLFNDLRTERFTTQYFHTLESMKRYIKERTSFSTYLVITSKDGSRVLYSTPEFEWLKSWLKENPPSIQEIKRYVEKKDGFELDGYFKKLKGFDLTKAIFSHIRRKLQVIAYLKTGELVFNYNRCLNKVDLSKEKLKKLYEIYEQRKNISKKQIDSYYRIAKKFKRKILKQKPL